ncbi:hypothetical protein [Methylomagnum ishizawai]|uniref:hypothetical protein n=1 Tax=Methylomagnum ishizawai TaxID=1760988 RepID=UPI001C3260F6|nr:hypothetical protein [Methylomagnum ishizawai]BBL75465.1 hypothetical protein MishRS11D_25630 [Methylomagnum ishizawai]
MYTEINAALQSAKVISEWLAANKSLRNYNELESAIADITSKLVSSNQALVSSLEKQKALSDRISALEKYIADIDDFQRQIERYTLHTLATGALVYILKPGMENNEPPHYLCNNCVENKKLSKLQPMPIPLFMICQRCQEKVWIKKSA